MVSLALINVPLLLISASYVVFAPSSEPVIAGGVTNTTCVGLTDFSPTATPFTDILTPLNSIGNGKLRLFEPTAVLAVMACGAEKFRIVSMPGPAPRTAAGVTGVGLGLAV